MQGRGSPGTGSQYVGILAAGALVFALAPLQCAAERFGIGARRALELRHEVEAETRKEVP